jgi:hypothetical protein
MTQENPERKTREIAIITDDYDTYENRVIAQSITDWEEVTEEQYDALVWYSGKGKRPYRVIERLSADEISPKAVKDYLAHIERQKELDARYEQQRLAEAERRKRQKAAREQNQLQRLAAKAGVALVPVTKT